MARIKLNLPDHYSFVAYIPVRITDINYGGHVGNDIFLSILHEARVQYLGYYGFKEFGIGGFGLIMTDVAIEFKSELFYGDKIKASVSAGEFSKIGFDIFYKLEKESAEKFTLVARAKTGMIFYDYATRKIKDMPKDFESAFCPR
ncbi:MAG TPA: thioesterase family protein [Puia sp.]|nr:thioesterase family protein [Puia sp.]